MSAADSSDNEEFERLDLTDSTYAKVIFNDVRDFYLANEDVNCAFTMLSSIEPLAGDKVALYKVGWSCVDDYIVAQPCRIEKSQFPVEANVTFAGSSLPKDNGEYYQFCYITANGEIRGGSTPFIFKNSQVEDFFSEEDIENDLMLIQTRTSILQGSLQNAIMEKTSLQIEKQKLEKECDSLKAQIIGFESMVKERDEKIKEMEAKLLEAETKVVPNGNALIEKVAHLEHLINTLKVEASAYEKEKSIMKTNLNELVLEKHALKENCSGLQCQLDAYICLEKTLNTELKSKQKKIKNLQALTVTLKENISENLGLINNYEKEQHELHMQHNAITARLADKEEMLAAMATSKSLATYELHKYSEKQLKIEAEKCCLSDQCEKYKEHAEAMVEQIKALEKEKLELGLQLNLRLSENAVANSENKLLLEEKTKLQEESSKLNLEVKDLQCRLSLGGEEYRRKYIEWHKMQNKVLKLQKKLLSLQANKQDCHQYVTNLQQPASNLNEQACSSEAQDANCSLTDLHSACGSRVLFDTKNVSACANLNQEQNAKIHAAMENQLQKFHGTKSSSDNLRDVSVGENGDFGQTQVKTHTADSISPLFSEYPIHRRQRLGLKTYSSRICAYPLVSAPYSCLSLPRTCETPLSISACGKALTNGKPSTNNQVLTQENEQTQSRIQASLELESVARNPEVEIMNSPQYAKCPICDEFVPENIDINEHLDNHFYFNCPVCFDNFHKEDYDIDTFNSHVLAHLN